MREILFRGKSVNDGNWVQGSLVVTTIEPSADNPIKHYHIEDMTIGVFPNGFQSGLSETVDPETVGQFTGLTDKNGKKIFEGDIVRHYNNGCDVSAFEVGAIRWNEKYACFERTSLPGTVRVHDECRYEVIGNIYDNPEILANNTNDHSFNKKTPISGCVEFG